jgi:hypothetical protein
MRIDGTCFCGEIAYEAGLLSPEISLCHCSDCQALSGSPYRATATARQADFRVTKGEPAHYVKTGSSGLKSAQYFCRTCGSNLYRIGENDDKVGIRIGTIRQRHQLRPTDQTWLQSGLEWAQDIREVPVRLE